MCACPAHELTKEVLHVHLRYTMPLQLPLGWSIRCWLQVFVVICLDFEGAHPFIACETNVFNVSLHVRCFVDVWLFPLDRRSMVINCVPTAKGRYEMLVGYRNHLRNGGHLFLVLPLLCLTKSTRTTRESFLETLSQIGFTVVAKKETPKVAFFCLRNTPLEARGVQVGGSSQATKEGGTRGGGATKGTSRKRNRGANDFAVSP